MSDSIAVLLKNFQTASGLLRNVYQLRISGCILLNDLVILI